MRKSLNVPVFSGKTYFQQIVTAWSRAWKSTGFRVQAIVTACTLACFPAMFRIFFDFVENRQGVQLNDYFLDILPNHDISWTVFFFLYFSVLIGVFCNLTQPKSFLLSFQTYCLVTFIRLLTITCFPLEPPIGYIPLREPIVQMVTNGGRIISRDLFFSGHVATVLSLYFTVNHRVFRPVLLMFAIMVSIGVLVQHVHYTIDVLAAPFGTLLSLWICKSVFQKSLKPDLIADPSSGIN